MPKARKRTKKSHGRRKSAGRFSLPKAQSEVLAMRILGRGLLAAAICVLASSTLSDPLQKLTMEGWAESARIQAGRTGQGPRFDDIRAQQRLALLRRIAGDADAVRHLSLEELSMLFGEPTLKREEPEAVSWHFTSGECALDVYFPRRGDDGRLHDPVYAEYRVRGQMQEDGLKPGKGKLDHKACVRSLFSHARFSGRAGAKPL